MAKRPLPPSAHDVARLAGVSQAAVSRAFTPGASIAQPTREKVSKAAEALGYRPNLHARSLIVGSSGIIGIIIGNPRYAFFYSVFDALSARLSALGKFVLVYTADIDTAVDDLVENLLRFRVDAIFLMAAAISPRTANHCTRQGVPVASLRSTRATDGLSTVGGENIEGGRAIARHMLEAGYRDFAFLAGSADSPTAQERERGFVGYLNGEGVPVRLRAVGNLRREGAIGAARQLLGSGPPPDAIFCVNDSMALATIEVAKCEFGLDVGRQIGIAGFDDIEQAAWPLFDLTTFSLPVDKLVDAVLSLLIDPEEPENPRRITIKGELKPRGSTNRSCRPCGVASAASP